MFAAAAFEFRRRVGAAVDEKLEAAATRRQRMRFARLGLDADEEIGLAEPQSAQIVR